MTIQVLRPGLGGLGRLTLSTVSGARVTAWSPAGGAEHLFLSQKSAFRAGAAIRGGIPICFPQFSGFGLLPRHGFARTMSWEFMGYGPSQAERATATFRLRDSETTRAIWPHPFEAHCTVTLTDSQLMLDLAVTNTGGQPFTFTAALHTYLRVNDIRSTQVDGLAGLQYFDQVTNLKDQFQQIGLLTFTGETDRVYYNNLDPLTVRDGERITQITATGFPDSVIWNPWIDKGAALADLEAEGYRHMVCVEAALIGVPARLETGQAWHGSQTLHS